MNATQVDEILWPSDDSRFHRKWTAPPGERERRPMGPTTGPAGTSSKSSNTTEINAAARRMQRATDLDRAADHYLHLGHHRAAERLAGRAADLRERP